MGTEREKALEYAQLMRDLRRAKDAGLAAWEALGTQQERISAMEAERDDLRAEAAQIEAAGGEHLWRASLRRRDAEAIQERISKARKPKRPTCGQMDDHGGTGGSHA